jgi:hypothetical protein
MWRIPDITGFCPSPRAWHVAVSLNASQLLVFGGNGPGQGDASWLNDMYILQLNTLSWKPVQMLSQSPRLRSISGVWLDNQLLVVGMPPHSGWMEAHLFSWGQRTWQRLRMEGTIPRDMFGSALSYDRQVGGGKVYFTGSAPTQAALSLLEVQLSPPSWKSVPTKGIVPSARGWHSALVYEEKLYVVGGFETKSTQCSNTVAAFVLSRGEWEIISTDGQRPIGRESAACTLIGGQILLHGGFDGMERQSDLQILDLCATDALERHLAEMSAATANAAANAAEIERLHAVEESLAATEAAAAAEQQLQAATAATEELQGQVDAHLQRVRQLEDVIRQMKATERDMAEAMEQEEERKMAMTRLESKLSQTERSKQELHAQVSTLQQMVDPHAARTLEKLQHQLQTSRVAHAGTQWLLFTWRQGEFGRRAVLTRTLRTWHKNITAQKAWLTQQNLRMRRRTLEASWEQWINRCVKEHQHQCQLKKWKKRCQIRQQRLVFTQLAEAVRHNQCGESRAAKHWDRRLEVQQQRMFRVWRQWGRKRRNCHNAKAAIESKTEFFVLSATWNQWLLAKNQAEVAAHQEERAIQWWSRRTMQQSLMQWLREAGNGRRKAAGELKSTYESVRDDLEETTLRLSECEAALAEAEEGRNAAESLLKGQVSELQKVSDTVSQQMTVETGRLEAEMTRLERMEAQQEQLQSNLQQRMDELAQKKREGHEMQKKWHKQSERLRTMEVRLAATDEEECRRLRQAGERLESEKASMQLQMDAMSSRAQHLQQQLQESREVESMMERELETQVSRRVKIQDVLEGKQGLEGTPLKQSEQRMLPSSASSKKPSKNGIRGSSVATSVHSAAAAGNVSMPTLHTQAMKGVLIDASPRRPMARR